MSFHVSNIRRRSIKLSAIAAGMLASGVALADARLDTQLLSKMAVAKVTDELQVVISYNQSAPVTPGQIAALQSLGITKGVTMRALPIAGALATPAEIRALAKRSDVASIYFNAPLRYYNQQAREITSVARAQGNQADFNRALPFSGKGVTVLVNDSGIDATHSDLKLGEHVVQNVLGAQNILAELATEVAPGIVPVTWLENVPNTDLGSGHGTHCAGTVAGTGARSNGLHRGVAPGADLVGYGSGAVILVLDAVGGLDYAAVNQFSFRNTIRVTSNSWGSSGPFEATNPVNIATYELYKRGIVSVFAAGNDGPGENTHNPYAQAPWVISVGAGEKDGVLTSFSSRGKRGETGTFTMSDGTSWTYVNEPTIVAPGVDIISTRDPLGALPPLEAQHDAETLDPAHLPFYTHMSGTSMATPHVAGVIALLLEANPQLTPAQVKDLLRRTATNMTARLPWEAGAGHINAYAALGEAAGMRNDFGKTVNALLTFNANAILLGGVPDYDFSVDFAPVGALDEDSFYVGDDISWVGASADIGDNTLALVLIDPDGVKYGSAISTPIGTTVSTGAPGKKGTWKVGVRGIGSVSGVALDPLKVTNGYGAPGTVTGKVNFLRSGGYTGMDDVAGHPQRQAIEFAIANRLMDGKTTGVFSPDANLLRRELARYLVLGASVRQYLPLNRRSSFTDLVLGNDGYPFAEAVVAKGAPLRDLSNAHDGVMGTLNGQFRQNDSVTRVSLAYSLVQAMGLQDQARAFSGSLTVFVDGKRIPVDDAASIAPSLRGYVQQALDQGLLNARFTLTQGPFDLQPTLHANFDPSTIVTRAGYAVAAGRFMTAYKAAED